MAFSVEIKHAGKQHKVEYNPVDDAKAFKESIYQVTGVPTDRMKVMVKGGILKDDADMSKIAIKEGQVITVIGTAGPLPQAPAKKLTFLEDMDDSDLASALKQPPGLTNLGNTCYMNASLQALRTIPELKTVLSTYRPSQTEARISSISNEGSHSGVTSDLRNLFVGMDKTTEAIPPFAFLNSLRRVNPQFAEQSQHGGYAQQDADEMWTQTLSSLRHALPGGDGNDSASGTTSFIDNYLSADLEQVLTCDEAPEEPKSIKTDKVLKLDCNININTNYMLTGIKDSFDQKIEKNSPTLNRTAVYTQTSRLARLPANLTVHMVRFYWRADVQKKAKIMRKVKFPLELDVSELLTDGLRDKFRPVNLALKNIDKARADRAKQRKKRKNNIVRASTPGSSSATPAGSSTPEPSTGDADVMEVDTEEKEVPEEEMREKERQQVKDLIKAQGGQGDAVEKGSNQTGLYELCAIVTHKGATADSGHYIGWTRQPTEENGVPGEEDWWKFDDDKVSVVPMTKIMALDGGGEDSTAYILLYRSKTV